MSAAASFSGDLVFIGAGRMGGALLAGALSRGLIAPGAVSVIEPDDGARAAAAALGVTALADLAAYHRGSPPGLALIAVKPQVMEDVLPAYGPWAAAGTVFVSIAAGRTVASIARVLGAGAAIIRAMPNTPAQVGRGVTALFAGAGVSDEARAQAAALTGAVGDVVWLEDEALMDAVTAVSGSGPAYVFHMIEALDAAARAAGLPADMAETLARATVTGAAELAFRSPESAAVLRQQVTSPGGTTEAALKVLMAGDGLAALMTRAVAEAKKRSEELAG